jgi:hypothetical protein
MPIKNALAPESLNALGAAFGFYPQLRRNRTVQDPRAALDIPVQVVRGRVATTLGTVSDILNMLRTPMPMEMYGDTDYGPQTQVPYGSQELLKTLPLPPQGPAQQAAANLGALAPMTPAEALQAARLARQAALAGGKTVKQAAKIAGEELNAAMMGERPGTLLGAVTPQPLFAVPPSGRSGFGAFDPRYDPRKKEQARLQAMTREIELNPNAQSGPIVSLADFEGRPFITSMSDRTAAGGRLVGIDDVAFNRPVELMGGQDYMFNNPGQVWASAQGPVKQLLKQANAIKKATGEDPLYMPWRMAPTGGDFAAMTGETMLSYADAAMGKSQKMALDKSIKNLIPDWAGVSNPASVEQFRGAKDKTRKAIKKLMDVNFREEGGLNIGGARLAVSDPTQLNAQTGGVMNVGEIFTGRPMVMESGHPSYPRGVPGQGLGTLAEDRNIFELLPEVAKARGIPDPMNPRTTDIRALQMKPYAGVITNELLKRLGY